jgi:hypothetical protein
MSRRWENVAEIIGDGVCIFQGRTIVSHNEEILKLLNIPCTQNEDVKLNV